MNPQFRLLYLSFALPPGLRALHPEINPAGNAFETQMVAELRRQVDLRSVGLLPFPLPPLPADAEPSSGVAHDLYLEEHAPELWHRMISLRRLKQKYLQWLAEGWQPDAVMIYNLSPVYNAFIRWLRRQSNRPRLVLLLLDSAQLGKKMPFAKKLRYKFKPFTVPDETMLREFDRCIGLSPAVERYFQECGIPFLWMPGACTPARAPVEIEQPLAGPLRFCYFGALAGHAGVTEMARIFAALPGEGELHICGYGKQAEELREMARQFPRLKFHGLLPSPEDCLRLGQSCDVLINPRPSTHGNENNVASKLFDYALCRRAIIASRISGTDEVLGPEAFYFDPQDYENSLRQSLAQAMNTSRAELRRRGEAIGRRIRTEYTWARQAERMAEFLRRG
jgi:glycosyltransferase involved in cell wall biosynthesis